MSVLSGKKVLVVDDEEDLREILAFEFEAEGCEVQEAENGRKALEKLRSTKFDIVVSDIRMPGGDGVELLDNLGSVGEMKPKFFFFTTGFSDITEEEAMERGAKGFFKKPYNLKDMVHSIADLVND